MTLQPIPSIAFLKFNFISLPLSSIVLEGNIIAKAVFVIFHTFFLSSPSFGSIRVSTINDWFFLDSRIWNPYYLMPDDLEYNY